MSVLQEGKITEEALAELTKRIGVKLRVKQNNELACKENIRRFASGMGDINPLWRDEEYAKKTRYGTIVAPPAWYYSVSTPFVQQGLPGVHAFHSGNDWEFYKPVLLMDRIRPEIIFTGFEEKKSQFAGKMIMEYQDFMLYNQRNELTAKAKTWIVRTERSAARKTGKYAQIQLPHPWTEEELKKIEDDVLKEEIRGAKTRYWEDVKVGEEMPPLIKGPFGLTDEIAWTIGYRELPAHGAALRQYRAHPSWAFRDPDTHAMEPLIGVHWNKHAANGAGLPACYDIGIQRNAWVLHSLTDWIGDEGWIKRSYVEYRKFFYFSDVVWLAGKVTKKYVDENGEYCVDLETTGINQRQEETTPGHHTVILPSKQAKTWPVEKRLPNK
ncbi:MAG: MaoC family dehydratase N-terminal domain-containing protein [Dehalococcoidales bacterium]|nr:MaoC family dehydratase N-terminal domain-containing protein [Dehalococcoidales bacterium]